MYQNIDLVDFQGREEALEKIIRYKKYYPMFYRTNLLIHTKRVRWMLEDMMFIFKKAFPELDCEKARILAEIHDDPETITGDTLYCLKCVMSQEETKKMKEEEENAIEELAKKWPKEINGYSYKKLLLHASRKDIIETILVSFVDKIDAWCESLHELFAGNRDFHVEKGIFSPPVQGTTIAELPFKYPELQKLFKYTHPFLAIIPRISKEEILRKGKLHTFYSLQAQTGITHYDHWKYITINKGEMQGLSWLTFPVEKLLLA